MARKPILVTTGKQLEEHGYNPLMERDILSGTEPSYEREAPQSWQELACRGHTDEATQLLFGLRGESGFRGDYEDAKRVVEQFEAAHRRRGENSTLSEGDLRTLSDSPASEFAVAVHWADLKRVNLGEAFYFIWLFKQTQPSAEKQSQDEELNRTVKKARQ